MEFTKMQGTGNDYVYVDCFKETVRDPAKTAVYVSDRHFGVGSDGLILIYPSRTADCRMEMYNADGSQGIMCGNGVRCVGKYVYDHGLVDKDKRTITVETLAGIKTLELETEDGRAVSVTVDMGRQPSHPGCRRILRWTGSNTGLWESMWEIPMQSTMWTRWTVWIWSGLGRPLRIMLGLRLTV